MDKMVEAKIAEMDLAVRLAGMSCRNPTGREQLAKELAFWYGIVQNWTWPESSAKKSPGEYVSALIASIPSATPAP